MAVSHCLAEINQTTDCFAKNNTLDTLNPNYESDQKTSITSYTEVILYLWTCLLIIIWFIMIYYQVRLGKVFAYKGNDKIWKAMHKLSVYSWWSQTPIIFISFTWPGYLLFDMLTILFTSLFGGAVYSDWRHYAGLNLTFNPKWNFLITVILQGCHHFSVTYFILFETNENKLLYRLLMVYAWYDHLQGCLTNIFGNYVGKYELWLDRLYSAMSPFVYLYWYLNEYKNSNTGDDYMSPGILMLAFGRWVMAYNYLSDADLGWRCEGPQVLCIAIFLYIIPMD